MQNLIDNALKFTSAGGRIIIQTNIAKRGIEVSVSDSGIGVPGEEKSSYLEGTIKVMDL